MEALDSTLYLSNDDLFLFARGEWYRSYEKMGAHPAQTDDGTKGYHFAVWAPDVQSVHVIGDFNGWDETATPLTQTETGGVWEGFVPGIEGECLYKYLIVSAKGEKLYKARPPTASMPRRSRARPRAPSTSPATSGATAPI